MYITNALDELQYQSLHSNYVFNVKFLTEICEPHEKLVFFALGKSYHAAKLAISIANSYGLRWYLVDAANASHGDMGIVGPKDILFFISNSGKTQEVLKVASHPLFNQNRKISITNDKSCPLAHACDINLELKVDAEYSPFGLAPMTSSVYQVLFINELVASIVETYHVSLQQYQQNHPAGSIGESILTTVEGGK